MSASPELQTSRVALDQIFTIHGSPAPTTAPQSSSASPVRQLQLHLRPAKAHDDVPTISAYQRPEQSDRPSAAVTGDDFTTPTGDAHRIPATDASCDCPPAPKKLRPSTSTGPACRRRLIQGDLLSVPSEEVERIFGRTWTRTPPMSPAAAGASPVMGAAGPAVLPAKKRKRS